MKRNEINIIYTANDQLWKIEDTAKKNGFSKVADAYWVQLFENEMGEKFVTTREDAASCDPLETLEKWLESSQETEKTYIFETVATMKEYNRHNWWIDRNIIERKTVKAASVKQAIEKYRERVINENYIDISKTAVREKNPMYMATLDGEKQVGYVITASIDFQNDSGRFVKQYIDLWIEINEIKRPKF